MIIFFDLIFFPYRVEPQQSSLILKCNKWTEDQRRSGQRPKRTSKIIKNVLNMFLQKEKRDANWRQSLRKASYFRDTSWSWCWKNIFLSFFESSLSSANLTGGRFYPSQNPQNGEQMGRSWKVSLWSSSVCESKHTGRVWAPGPNICPRERAH